MQSSEKESKPSKEKGKSKVSSSKDSGGGGPSKSPPVAQPVTPPEEVMAIGKEDENSWECSVCTFRNSPEAFKCLMCDVRKGTSTRKPRINPQLVAQQVARQQQQIQQQALKASSSSSSSAGNTSSSNSSSVSKTPEKELISSGKLPLPATGAGNGAAGQLSKDPKVAASVSSSSSGAAEKRKSMDMLESGPSSSSPGPSQGKSLPSSKREKKETDHGERARLRGVDRKNSNSEAITVNNVTVIITEFQPKKKKSNLASSEFDRGPAVSIF